MSKEATKHDQNKPPLDLLPTKALEEIALAFDYGAKKYSRYNWCGGFNWSRLIGASMRHLNAFNSGENLDEESKLSHLSHLGACVMMLIEHQKRNLGKDDRYKW